METVRCSKCRSTRWEIVSPYVDIFDTEDGTRTTGKTGSGGDVEIRCANCNKKATLGQRDRVFEAYNQ